MLKERVPPASVERSRIIGERTKRPVLSPPGFFRDGLNGFFVPTRILFENELGCADARACQHGAWERRQLGCENIACGGMLLPACASVGTGIRHVWEGIEDLNA